MLQFVQDCTDIVHTFMCLKIFEKNIYYSVIDLITNLLRQANMWLANQINIDLSITRVSCDKLVIVIYSFIIL